MKKTIVLTVILCLVTRLFAANPTDFMYLFCDFESSTVLPASQFHAPDGGGTVSIVVDPVNSINHVLKVVTPTGENWGGCIFNEVSKGETYMNTLCEVPAITGYDCVEMLMYRVDNTHVPQLKTVDVDDDGHTDVSYLDLKPLSVDGDKDYVADGKIKKGEWQWYAFNVTHCHNSGVKFIYIMPDREDQSTVYIDDIRFIKDQEKPTMGTATCGISTDGSISIYVTATDNMSDPVNHYMVATDGNLTHATDYLVTSGVITITGLSAETEYTFTIWAKDYAGNVSDNSATCTCSTTEAAAGNWCHKSLKVSVHTIDVSCEKKDGKYVLTIESNEVMSGLGGTYCYINNKTGNYQLNASGHYTISDAGKKITCEIVSSTDPEFYTSLFVLMPGGEVTFPQLTDITWGKCASSEPCTPPSAGGFAWTDRYQPLIYSLGAHPYDLEFTSLSGTDLQFEWHYNYTGEVNPSDPIYSGSGWDQKNLTPPTTALGDVYYWCRVYNECGSDNSEIAFVRIVDCSLSAPVSIFGPSTVTEGNALRFEMQYPAANGGYKTIRWYHNGNLISTRGWPADSIHSGTLYDEEPQRQASILTINPCSMSDGGCYYCVMQDGQSCTMQSNTICVTINQGTPPDPEVVNHPQIEICLGESVSLIGAATGPWKWNTGAITQEITVEGTAVGTTAYSCTTASQIDNYTVKVKDCMVIINHDPQTVCLGETIVLEGGATGPWNWSTTETTQQITIVCSTLGTFNYTCTTSLQTDNYTITVEDCTPPPPTEITHPEEDVCLDSVKVLEGGAVGPWQWSTGETTRTISVVLTTEGKYEYTCTTSSQIDYFTLNAIDCTPPPPPVEPCEDLIYRKWDDVLFVNNGDSLFVAYRWYKDGEALTGETKQYYYTSGQSMDGDGHTYHAVAFKADGSSVKACAYTFDAFTRSADQNPGDKQQIQIYPNPSRRNMPIHVSGGGESVLTIFNALGQRVAQYTGPEFTVTLPAGCYILQAMVDNQPICRTMIVE